jgi:nucleoside-diphosphate-sugar epimerase
MTASLGKIDIEGYHSPARTGGQSGATAARSPEVRAMRVAVTGANGFLGAHTVAALRRAGHRVRALVRSRARRQSIAAFVDEWRTGELGDAAALRRLAGGADAVVHIAMDWAALGKGARANVEGNLLPALRLLELAHSSGAQFLFVSTLEVYGELLPDRALDERHPAWPASTYGAFKASVEAHLEAYHRLYGMNASAWRPATMLGVQPRLEHSHWFEQVRRARRGEPIAESGDNDVVWVADVAEALALAVGDPSVAGELYNLVDLRVPGGLVAAMAAAPIDAERVADQTPLRRPRGFDNRKARNFFARHGRPAALRRGAAGVECYVRDLLQRLAAGRNATFEL